MIGKLVLGTTKDSSIPVILKETGPELYIEKTVNNQGVLKSGSNNLINLSNVSSLYWGSLAFAYYYGGNLVTGTVPDFSNIVEVQGYSLCCSFSYCNLLTGDVDLSSLTSISGNYGMDETFCGCVGITSVDMSSLTTITQNYSCYSTFQGCTGLISANLGSLTTISGSSACYQMFQNCSNLKNINLSSLTSFGGTNACRQMFEGCTSIENVDLSSFTTASGDYSCYRMFKDCTGITDIDLSSLETISGSFVCQYMFQNCNNITEVDLSSLRRIYGSQSCYYMFYGCTNLETVDFSNLVEAYYNNTTCQYMFQNCTNLTNIEFPKLQGIPGGSGNFYCAFQNCSSLTKNPFTNLTQTGLSGYMFDGSGIVDGTFPKLAYISGRDSYSYDFRNCHNLEKLDFPALTRIYGTVFKNNFIYGCDNANFTKITFPMFTVYNTSYVPFESNCFNTSTSHTIEVHFRKDIQSTVEAMSGYASCFGASAILFDLIGTITVNGNTYRREGSCNKPGYIAWQKIGSTVTLDNGNSYTYNRPSIGYWSRNNDTPLFDYPGAMYYWLKVGETSYSATTSFRSPHVDLQVGELVYEYSTDYKEPTFEVVATDMEFIYTSDSVEPDVGDNAYSDISGTVLGTITAVA